MDLFNNNYTLINGTSNQTFLEFLNTLSQINEDNEMSEENRNLLLISSYSLIIIISFVGNLLVCKVLFGQNRPNTYSSFTITNILIINLAISDLLMTLLNIPFNIARFVLENWPFGESLCVFVPFIQSVSVHSSSITMVFIAFERYKSVCLNSHLNDTCFCRLMPFGRVLSIIWLSSAFFSIPHGLYHNVIEDEKAQIIRCIVVYPEPKEEFRQFLTLIAFLSQYLIPILLTCFCYLRLSFFLCGKKIVGTVSETQRQSTSRRKRQRIKMLVVVVLVFAGCWLPLNIFHLLLDFEIISYNSLLFFVTHWLAMSSVCYNPFIYLWLNDDFKHRIKSLFNCVTNV